MFQLVFAAVETEDIFLALLLVFTFGDVKIEEALFINGVSSVWTTRFSIPSPDDEIMTPSKKALYINSYGSYDSISEISSKQPLNNVNSNQQVDEFNSNNKQGNKRLKRKIDKENTVN